MIPLSKQRTKAGIPLDALTNAKDSKARILLRSKPTMPPMQKSKYLSTSAPKVAGPSRSTSSSKGGKKSNPLTFFKSHPNNVSSYISAAERGSADRSQLDRD